MTHAEIGASALICVVRDLLESSLCDSQQIVICTMCLQLTALCRSGIEHCFARQQSIQYVN